jgi:prophage maintenance system killer protein
MTNKMELVLYKTENGDITINVGIENDTVWLNQGQMVVLFQRDQSVISRHINNLFSEGEVDMESNMHFLHNANSDKPIAYYSLDVIISVGYRVKSQRGVDFRKWANSVLRDYILKGYSVNNDRINQLGEIIRIMKRTENKLETNQILTVIERFTLALDMLDDYDHQKIKKPEGNESIYFITYDECKEVIKNMKFNAASELFGSEKDESFKSSISSIYLTFDGEELYPTVEEKAAHLLYFITKNHSFTDGNKRIAAALFIYFLDKNQILFIDDKKIMEDYTLVAITIMIAESRPDEKEVMVRLVMNFLCGR